MWESGLWRSFFLLPCFAENAFEWSSAASCGHGASVFVVAQYFDEEIDLSFIQGAVLNGDFKGARRYFVFT
jgi:hypothetical protein